MNPASHVATRQANTCFEEIDMVLEEIHASSSAAALDDTESEATGPFGDTSSWLFCAHTDSLVQVHPAVLASYANALAKPPFFAEVSRQSRNASAWKLDSDRETEVERLGTKGKKNRL